MSSTWTWTGPEPEPDRGPILEAFRDALIDAVEDGPAAVEKQLATWCTRHPELADDFRKEAQAILALWGLREPERIGAYQLLDVLTVGGMGKIYRAREDVTGRIVVVKTVLAGHLSPAEQVARFDTERRLLSRLHATHIVPLLATGQEGYLLYLVMPLIPGITLRALIESCSRHDPEDARAATFETLFAAASRAAAARQAAASIRPNAEAEQPARPPGAPRFVRQRLSPDYLRRAVMMMEHVAGAVQHIHEAKILHRDLKPSNIMVESSGHSWVIDIGVGRDLATAPGDDIGPEAPVANDAMTRGIGTLWYMAPEQLPESPSGDAPGTPTIQDARTDVWGLGATLYELITLRPPFEGETTLEIARKILSEPPTRPRARSASIPRELEAACLKALEKAPEDRYPSASAFADDLRRWLDGVPTVAGKAGPLKRTAMWARRRKAAAFAAGMTAAFAIAASLGAAQIYERDIEREREKTEKTRRQLEAEQRERQVLALPQLRMPIHKDGWFEKYTEHVRHLRGDSTAEDPLLQGQAAAALEGIDAVVTNRLPGAANSVVFDPNSERLLMVRSGKDPLGKRWSRTTLRHRATDQTLVERELGPGEVAFRSDGTPLQLSTSDEDHPKQLALFDVKTGAKLHEFQPSRPGEFQVWSVALARQGTHACAVIGPIHDPELLFTPEGMTTTIDVWDAVSGRRTHRFEHKATKGVAIAPDGSLLAAWDITGAITVWALADGRRLAPIRVGRCPVNCLTFGRDPMWSTDAAESLPPWLLGVGESSGLITVWDLRSGRPRSVCRGSYVEVTAMDFSVDGALLLSGGRAPTKLWDVATGTCLLDLGESDFARAIAFAPNGRHVAVSFDNTPPRPATVSVAELELGHGILTLYGVQGRVERTCFSPDGKFIAAATHEWQVGIWEWPSGRLHSVLPAPVGLFVDSFGMAFDRDGRRFACSSGHEAQLWDLQAGRRIKQWKLNEGLCENLAFIDPDRLLLVRYETQSGKTGPFTEMKPRDDPRVARIYDLLGPAPTTALKTISDFSEHIFTITLAPDSSIFCVDGRSIDKAQRFRRCITYEALTGKPLHAFPFETGRFGGVPVLFDPNSKVLGVSLRPDRLTLFDLPDFKFRGVTAKSWSYYCLSPRADSALGSTEAEPGICILTDPARGQPLLRIDVNGDYGTNSFSFSPNGRHAIHGRRDGSTISVLDFAEMKRWLNKVRLGW